MESSENKVIQFQSNRSALKKVNENLPKKEENILENNQGNGNGENIQNSSGIKSFFGSKKGIILLSVIGALLVAGVVIAVIAIQVNKKKDNNGNENNAHHSHTYGDFEGEIFDDDVDDDEDIMQEEDITGQYRSDLNKDNIFISPFSSLTKNNQMKASISQSETRNVPTDAQYFYTNFDNYARDTQVRDTVKLVPKLKNIHGNQNCQVQLIIFLDSSRTNSKSGGQTENGVIDSSTYIMNFQKFFIMEYYFEKDQPIEFRITGSINGTIKTSLPNIMGSRGQTLNKPIEGTDGVILEVKGFSYKTKLTSTLKVDVSMNGSLYGKGLMYSIKAKGNMSNPLNTMLYKSEVNSPLKNVKNIRFKQCSIPDIYVSNDGNYETSLVGIELFDAKHNKKVGEYNGP
jgi:hypothetical protein